MWLNNGRSTAWLIRQDKTSHFLYYIVSRTASGAVPPTGVTQTNYRVRVLDVFSVTRNDAPEKGFAFHTTALQDEDVIRFSI